MRKKQPRLLKIADLLPEIMKCPVEDKKSALWALTEKWPEIVGGSLSHVTRPLSIHSEMLRSGVPNSAWANELQLLSLEILEKIKASVPEIRPGIRELRFQIVTRSVGSIG